MKPLPMVAAHAFDWLQLRPRDPKEAPERAAAELSGEDAESTQSASLSKFITARAVQEARRHHLDSKRLVARALVKVQLLPPKTNRMRLHLHVDGLRVSRRSDHRMGQRCA